MNKQKWSYKVSYFFGSASLSYFRDFDLSFFKRDQYLVLSLVIRKNIWFLSFASWPTELIDRFDPPELFSTTVPPPESFCAASEASILIRFSSKTRAQIGTNFACILIGQKGLLIFDEIFILKFLTYLAALFHSGLTTFLIRAL